MKRAGEGDRMFAPKAGQSQRRTTASSTRAADSMSRPFCGTRPISAMAEMLQRTAGNRATIAYLRHLSESIQVKPPVAGQAPVTIGPNDDASEREAQAVAERSRTA